jgi:hypothetical protein
LKTCFKKGVKLEDKDTGASLCVYKEDKDRYYTLVIEETSNPITIITAYTPGKWQIKQYHKVKKYDHTKMY